MSGLDRLVLEELRRIVETLEHTQNRLTILRAVLPPDSTEHAVVGCCLLDRLAPLIGELGALTEAGARAKSLACFGEREALPPE